jgi:hypothetical protein
MSEREEYDELECDDEYDDEDDDDEDDDDAYWDSYNVCDECDCHISDCRCLIDYGDETYPDY